MAKVELIEIKLPDNTESESQHQRQLKLIRDDLTHEIVDVQFQLTHAQRTAILQHCRHEGLHFSQSCASFIVGNELAKAFNHTIGGMGADDRPIYDYLAEVRQFSGKFIALEELINSHQLIQLPPAEALNTLLDALKTYRQTIDNPLGQKLLPATDQAIAKLEDLKKAGNITLEMMKELLGTQALSKQAFCLGDFVNQQAYALTGTAIAEVYRLRDHTPADLFNMHPAIKAISEARSKIELRGSGYGIRTNNMLSPIPRTQLETSRAMSGQSVADDSEALRWMSLKPYTKRIGDPYFIEEILAITDQVERYQEPTGTKVARLSLGFLTILASVVDLVPTVIRLAVMLPTAVVAAVYSAVKSAFTDDETEWPQQLDAYFSWCHNIVSPLTWMKKATGAYQQDDGNHGKLFDKKLNPGLHRLFAEQENGFDRLLTKQYGVNTLGMMFRNAVGDFFKSIWHAGSEAVAVVYDYFSKSKAEREQALSKTIHEKIEAKQRQIVTEIVSRLKQEHELRQQKAAVEPAVAADSESANTIIATDSARSKSTTSTKPGRPTHWPATVPWTINHINSPLDFVDEIFTVLSDDVIDAMFRTSPGPATIWLLVAQVSLGMSLAPAAMTQAFGPEVVKAINAMSNAIAKSFMGRQATADTMSAFFTAFLQWKITFFASEGVLELSHGNTEFLEEMFAQPEKITLGTVVLVATGMALGFIPRMPETVTVAGVSVMNPWAMGLNLITDEARECGHGTPGLNSLEFAFLSLKSLMLLHSLSEGGSHTGKRALNPEQLTFDLMEQDILAADLTDPQIIARFQLCFAKQQIAIATDQSERIFSELVEKVKTLRHSPEANRGRAVDDDDTTQHANAREAKMSEQSGSAVTVAPQTTAPSQASSAKDRLFQALHQVKQMEALGLAFDSKWLARDYYDHLAHCFDEYHKPEHGFQAIDSERYLKSFFDKHCYQGSSNLFKLGIMVFHLTLIPSFLRGIKALLAWNNSPAVLHTIKRSYQKEGALLMQGLFFGGRVLKAGLRCLSYTLRTLAFIGTCIIGPLFMLGVLCFDSKKFDEMLSREYWHTLFNQIALHRGDLTDSTKALVKLVAWCTVIIPVLYYTNDRCKDFFDMILDKIRPMEALKETYATLTRAAGCTDDDGLLDLSNHLMAQTKPDAELPSQDAGQPLAVPQVKRPAACDSGQSHDEDRVDASASSSARSSAVQVVVRNSSPPRSLSPSHGEQRGGMGSEAEMQRQPSVPSAAASFQP